MKRILIVVAVTVSLAAWGGSVALGDDTEPVPADNTLAAPPTTSEFGTETEIEIALDDNGNIVPANSDTATP
jgi:hypothetical protein